MSQAINNEWVVYQSSQDERYYVQSHKNPPRDSGDKHIDEFPDRELAEAYADELNECLCKEEGRGTVAPIRPQQPGIVPQTPQEGAKPPEGQGQWQTLGPARPPAQYGQSQPVSAGRPLTPDQYRLPDGSLIAVDLLPQLAADTIDRAGMTYDTLNTILRSNVGLVLGRCRQGLAECRNVVSETVRPAITNGQDTLRLLQDTIAQHVYNNLSAAMETTAPVINSASFGGGQRLLPNPNPGQTDSPLDPNVPLPPTQPPPVNPPPWPFPPPSPIPDGQSWTLWTNGTSCYCQRVGEQSREGTDAIVGYYATFEDCNTARRTCSGLPPQFPPEPPAPPAPGPPVPPDQPPVPPGGIEPTYPSEPPPAGGWFWGGGGYYFYVPPSGPPPGFLCSQTGQGCRHPDGSITPINGPGDAGACFSQRGYSVPIPLCPNPGTYGPFPTPIPPTSWPPPTTSPPPPQPPIGSPPPPTPCPPCPTITSIPPPPSIPQHVGSCQPCPTELPSNDYCRNILQMRSVFICIGRALYSDGKHLTDAVSGVQQLIGNNSNWLFNAVRRILESVVSEGFYHCVYDNVKAATRQYRFTNSEDYLHLLACRHTFRWLDSLASDAGFNAVGEVTARVSTAPEIWGIGGGSAFNASWVGTQNIKSSIKLFCVPLLKSLDLCINYTCPEEIPSIGDAIKLYLADQITLDHCKCLVLLNGGVWEEFRWIIDAQRSRVDGLQTAMLYRRGFISLERMQARLRELGYIREAEQNEVLELTRYIPGPGDLVRFMLRDTEDKDVTDTFKTEDEFPEKFSGELEKMAYSQGISRGDMLRYWKAHWDWPSNTQLYEMLHRLRPDKVKRGELDEKLVTTKAMAEKVLAVNDVIPIWRDRLLAISYRPLTRVDARRAYNIGQLDDDGLVSTMRDQGYDEPTARKLLEFFRLLRRQSLRGNLWVKSYIRGGINGEMLASLLDREGIPQAVATEALEDAQVLILKEGRQRCVDALHKRFVLGEFSREEVANGLKAGGLDDLQAQAFANSWECERQTRSKHLTASKLCTYFERGLITAVEFAERLIRLNYKVEDVDLIIRECGIRVAEKRAKQEQALIEKAAKEQEKINRERAKAIKAAQAAADKQQRANESVQKSIDRLADRFVKAAARYARVRGIDTTDAASQMQSASISGISAAGLSDDEATELAVELAMAWKAREGGSFAVEYDKLVKARYNALSTLSQ